MHSQECLPNGIVFNKQSQLDSFRTYFPECLIIQGGVRIREFVGDPITSLEALSKIKQINGDLEISFNSLSTLFGLQNLDSIAGDLMIINNPRLKEITSLNNLASIKGGINISQNDSLATLNGLKRIKESPSDIFISMNGKLSSLEGLDSIKTVAGEFRIHQNQNLKSIKGLKFLKEVGSFAIDSNIILSDISSVISLNKVNQSLRIRYCNLLVNASVFKSINSIGESILIRSNQELKTIDFTGISKLPEHLELIRNTALESLNGFQNITSIGGDLIVNENGIQNLAGLEKLVSVGGFAKIINNKNLTSLSGINKLSSALSLGIGINDLLTSLEALNNSIQLTDSLVIYDNPLVQSLAGLDNANISNINHLIIQGNNRLTLCNNQSICAFLKSTPEKALITNNDTKCNSVDQVLSACTTATQNSPKSNIQIYPNPVLNILNISATNRPVNIRIINGQGQTVLQSKNSNSINVDHLNEGYYIIIIDGKIGGKFLKI